MTKTKALEAAVDSAIAGSPLSDVGLAIAIVDRSNPLLCKAYGNRIHALNGEPARRATLDTKFALGSATKSFTSFLLAQAEESGTLQLGRPIRDYLPSFEVMDPDATAQMTLEDILCQRTGIPRHDALWYVAAWTEDEIWDRLAYLDPSPDFRFRYGRAFQYNNNLYAMAGTALRRVSQQSWMQNLDRDVLRPLGITSISSSSNSMEPGHGDVARPYLYTPGQVIPLPFKDVTHIAAAAALNADARGLIPWLLLLTNEGVAPDSTVLLSKGAFRDLINPRMSTNATPTEQYGLGWLLDRVEGHRVAYHTGNCDGYSAWIGFLPDDGYALAALSNQHGFVGGGPDAPLPLVNTVAMTALRHLLGLHPPPDRPAPPATSPMASAPVTAVRSSLTPSDLTGTYHHDAYGDITVVLASGSLELHYFSHSWPLVPSGNGGFTFDLYAFGATYPVTPMFLHEWGETVLALPLEPRVGWARFQRRA